MSDYGNEVNCKLIIFIKDFTFTTFSITLNVSSGYNQVEIGGTHLSNGQKE